MPLSAFDLSPALAAKSDAALIATDEQHLAAVGASLAASVAELSARLDATRREPGGSGEEALNRDQQVHRLTARLRTLGRFGLDLCLGRMVLADGGDVIYVGRLGLTDTDGRRLLVDWRSPAAEPFFGATHADPMGLASRRRYRWTAGRIADYWDEVFDADGLTPSAALDDQSAFIAGLGASRSPRMRDVLGTIAADQNAIIRAGSRGTLVVDGGPGTGKTVVALHRAAYLLYADPRLGRRHGGVLFVGPHQPYLDYVEDVLPSLGEDGVRTCTLRDLVPGGVAMPVESDPEVARLKSSADMVRAIGAAVRIYEEPPAATTIETESAEFTIRTDDWAEAFAAVAGTPHNEARVRIVDELLDVLAERYPDETHRAELAGSPGLRRVLRRAWPLLEPTDLVGDLWSVPAYLRRCAPFLDADGVRLLQRAEPTAWTSADLPLLDAARLRLGDTGAEARQRQHDTALAAGQREMERVIDHLVASDDSEMAVMSMLKVGDLQQALIDEDTLPALARPDALTGPFAHVLVDEAQELTDAEWQMLLARCPSRSFTVVGDRAQARHGFTESWSERLERIGLDRGTVAGLTVNYRTPEEVMAAAEPMIRAALPDANVPTSIRRSGVPVRYGPAADLDDVLHAWLAGNEDGIACVIGDPVFEPMTRVRSLTPELAKGLEFDLVVVVDPDALGSGIEGAVDRYVAMTRATQELVVLTPATRTRRAS